MNLRFVKVICALFLLFRYSFLASAYFNCEQIQYNIAYLTLTHLTTVNGTSFSPPAASLLSHNVDVPAGMQQLVLNCQRTREHLFCTSLAQKINVKGVKIPIGIFA